MIGQKKQKRLHRVVLRYNHGITRSVFIRSYDRAHAEKRALKQNPNAIGIEHTKFPLS